MASRAVLLSLNALPPVQPRTCHPPLIRFGARQRNNASDDARISAAALSGCSSTSERILKMESGRRLSTLSVHVEPPTAPGARELSWWVGWLVMRTNAVSGSEVRLLVYVASMSAEHRHEPRQLTL
eukprot:CAMPEP_0174728822 /NCGR_PEP_ID=MMETSP1094-20130205/52486_1 /TAXON_ID=156173 /ORGANISM="Chrysochromulina brevifilum, Strain UTEX LB 985" /LENGTH=125 /DNA_ID=CAMNT_0015930819 /DNA_START=231 /DNA_END=605 /DNA_ORIENTATION=-